MCEWCEKALKDAEGVTLEVGLDGETFDVSTNEGIAGFAMKWIEKLSPEGAIVLNAIGDTLGANPVAGQEFNSQMVTTRDIVGGLILLKTLCYIIPTASIVSQCFEISVGLANLEQAKPINDYLRELPKMDNHSSVELINAIPKAN